MKLMKKAVCLIAVLALLLSTVCFAAGDTTTPPAPEPIDASSVVPANTQPTQEQLAQSQPANSQTTQAQAAQPQTSLPIAAEPETSTPDEFSDINYATPLGSALDTLVDKKIIAGFPDGTYKADQTLTRAEFAKIIVCFIGGDINITLDTGFPDVDNVGGSAHWAKSYIRVAKDMKIISGFPDGTFQPDSPVTYEQAVKMILCALGYTNYEYPQGFLQLGMQKKLYTNSTHTGASSDPVTRGSVAILVYNALSIPANNVAQATTGDTNVTYSIGGGGGGSSTKKGGGGGGGGGKSSAKEERHINGVIWGIEATMLDTSASLLDEDEITIRYTKSNEVLYETLPVASKYVKSLSKYLGQQVRVTVTEDDDRDEIVSELTVLETKNKTYTVNVEDFISFENTGDGYVMKYYEDNDAETIRFNDPENLYVIYNGKSICAVEPEFYSFDPSYILDNRFGSYTMLSNDGDNAVDVIFVTAYKTAVVNSRNTTSETIKCKYGMPDLDVSTRNRSVSIVNGNESTVALSAIKNYDVLDYLLAPDGSGISIIVSPVSDSSNVILGTVYSISDEKVKIKTSSDSSLKEYEFNYNYIDYLTNYDSTEKYVPEKDDRVYLHLNMNGKVADIEQITTSSDEKYGYVYNLGFASDKSDPVDEEDQVILRMFVVGDAKGSSKDHTVAQNVRIDGVLYKKQPDEVRDIILRAASVANQNKSAPLNTNTRYASFVRFELTNGQITLIDTILDEKGNLSTVSDEKYNTLIRSTYIYDETESLNGKYKYYSASPYGFYKTTIADRFRVRASSTDTTLIFVPGNRNYKAAYSSAKFATANFHNSLSYYVEAYNVDAQKYAQFVLQYITDGKSDISSFSTLGIITAVETEEETGSDKISYRSYANNSVNNLTVASNAPAYKKFTDLHIGDVILMSTDLEGKLYDYYYALDVTSLPIGRVDDRNLFYCTDEINDRRVKGFNYYPDDKQQVTTTTARYYTIYGSAKDYDYNNSSSSYGTLHVTPYLATDYLVPESGDVVSIELSSSTKLYVYDAADKTITAYTTASTMKDFLKEELITVKQNGGVYEDCDQVFVYTYNGNAVDVTSYTARIVYIVRTPAQANPKPYPGVIPPPDDPLEIDKADAINELRLYAGVRTYTEFSDMLDNALEDGIAAIRNSLTVDEILSAVKAAEKAIDDIPQDGVKDDAISEAENYVDPAEFPSHEDLIRSSLNGAIRTIQTTNSNTVIEETLALYKTQMDSSLLSEAVTNAKAAIQTYADENHNALMGSTDFTDFLGEKKTSLNAITTLGDLKEALPLLYEAIDEYAQSFYED